MTIYNSFPWSTSDLLQDNLLKYNKEYIIIGIIKFLNEKQRKDLLDSLDREVF